MSASVFAEGEEGTAGKTITLTGGKAGHTYTLYQIFTGDTTKNKGELTNIQYGKDAPDALKTAFETAAAAAKSLDGKTDDDARAFVQGLNLTGNGSKQVSLTKDGDVVFGGLEEGYYVILDKNNNEDAVEGDYSSAIIVKVVADVEGKIKGSAPTSEKKVDDKNDSNTSEDATTWQDSADYDIGDAVPFQLKATTADNVAAYKKYHVTFQDNYSEGLDAPTHFTVTVLGKTFTLNASGDAPAAQTTDNGTKISVAMGAADAGQDFAITVTFEPSGENPTYLNKECNGTEILVNYTQVLNNKAKIGAEGNPNTSYIKYSNNPESKDDSEEGKTPDDTVIVFTYKTTVDKVDETGAALKGADFALYKEVPAGTEGAQTGANIKADWEDAVKNAATALADAKYYVVAGKKGTVTEDTTQFSFNGIDDGTYVLVETAVPKGYNAWSAKEFTVTANHTNGDGPKLESLTGTDSFESDKWAGVVEMTKKNGEKYNTVSGEMFTEIENNSGATLPETGGIGTTIFYIVGAALVLGSAIYFISRRRIADR